jgi:hypothetical protein
MLAARGLAIGLALAMAMGAASDVVVKPLQSSSSTTASCAGREKEEYRRNRSIRVVGLSAGVGSAMACCVVDGRGFGGGVSHVSGGARVDELSPLASPARTMPELENRRGSKEDNRLMIACHMSEVKMMQVSKKALSIPLNGLELIFRLLLSGSCGWWWPCERLFSPPSSPHEKPGTDSYWQRSSTTP